MKLIIALSILMLAGSFAPAARADNSVFDDMGIAFVEVDGGTFDMGDTFGDVRRNEVPVHAVTIDGFFLSKTEITFAQYDRFCEETKRDKPDDAGWGRDDRPVINVSWDYANAFCEWLSQKSGRVIRLPTEAEWEYAARGGGKNVRFGNGKDTADPKEINFDGSEEFSQSYSVVGQNRKKTRPVADLSPNALGLYDMSGNVWEWCADWYDKNYYRSSPEQNPGGADTGRYRVIRGGSWECRPRSVRCSSRGAYTPDESANQIGFRVLMVP